MPIVTVEIVGEAEKEGLARSLAEVAGTVLTSRSGGTWVKVHSLPIENYSENGEGSDSVRPVFVSILLGQSYESTKKEEVAFAIATEFSKILGRPSENIHVLFEPDARGRIAFGGRLLT